MAKNTSFSLEDHFGTFIQTQIAAGRYSNASDVVRAGLRLLEERETQLLALRRALEDGEESGAATSFDFDEFVAAKKSAGKAGS